MPPSPQVTSLLTNDQLMRIERLRLAALRRFTNRSSGEHRTRRSGSSNEFCDYRDYVPGDDIRYVDWNIFARLRRPYIKLFMEQEQMHVVLLVDASASMLFEDKLLRARQLAAALGVASLLGGEATSVAVFGPDEGGLSRMGPRTGRAGMRELFDFLQRFEGGGDGVLEQGIDRLLRIHRGRGAVIVISDFLTGGDVRRAMSSLFSRGLEVYALQIECPTEIDPQVTSDLRLIDSETQQHLDITATGDLMNLYQTYRMSHQRRLEQWCRQRSGRHLAVSSAEPLDRLLFDRLRRKGWVV